MIKLKEYKRTSANWSTMIFSEEKHLYNWVTSCTSYFFHETPFLFYYKSRFYKLRIWQTMSWKWMKHVDHLRKNKWYLIKIIIIIFVANDTIWAFKWKNRIFEKLASSTMVAIDSFPILKGISDENGGDINKWFLYYTVY